MKSDLDSRFASNPFTASVPVADHRPMNPIRMLLLASLCILAQACAVSGVRRISMVDEHRRPVTGAAVVPLVTTSTGVGVGPDGHGISMGGRTYIAKPFEWSTGENLMKDHLQSSGAMIWPLPPFVAVASRRWVGKWLFLAKGCEPLVLTMNEIASNSYVTEAEREPTDRVFVLRPGTGNGRQRLIDALTAPQPDLEVVGGYLESPVGEAELDHGSVELLRSQR